MKMKKVASMILAATMSIGLSISAFAAPDDTREESRITYDILQIFTGQSADMDGGKVLANVKWGVNGIGTKGDAVSEDILKELADLTVSDEGSVVSPDRQKLDAVTKYVDWDSEAYAAALGSLEEVKSKTIIPGYYLVRVTPGTVGDAEVYPTYTVRVTGDKIGDDFKPKGFEKGVPTIEKKTDGNTSKSDVAIGDVVSFTITSTLPVNLHDYREYFWAATDTMSSGLTWADDKGVGADKAGVVSVKIDGKDVINEIAVTSKEVANGTEIVMGFNNIRAIDGVGDGAKVEIVYQAIVNNDAKIASAENTNEVVLEYSNDPNHSGDGKRGNDPDKTPEPDPEQPTGHTVKGENTTTQTWLTGLTVEHFGPSGKPMAGAEFVLSGENIKTVIKYTSKFSVDTNGSYWMLKDGSYTNVVPTDETRSQYNEAAGKFSRSDVFDATNEGPTEVTATIDANGMLTITGLKSGTYTLTNTKIPDGYNLAEPIEFTLSFDEDNLFSSDNEMVQERTDEWFYVTINAQNGTLLPETGGMGVYFLYAGGAVLLMAACGLGFAKTQKKSSVVA